MNAKKVTSVAGLVFGLAVLTALGLVSIHVPFGRDQGVAAYAAEIMARGGVIYRDLYHFNLPGIFFVYRLAMKTGLGWPEAANFMAVVFIALTYLVVFATARRALPPLSAMFAAWFYGAFAIVMYNNYWDIAQKESLACLALAPALFFFTRLVPLEGHDDRAPAPRPWLTLALPAGLAGAFSGFSAQFKPTLGIVLLTMFYAARWYRGDKARAGLIIFAGIAGFIISFIPLVIYMVNRGALDAMTMSFIRFSVFYGGQEYAGALKILANVTRNLIRWLYNWRFLTVLAAIAIIRLGRREYFSRLVIVFGGLLLFQVILQMKFFTYHFIVLLIPASILAAQGGALMVAAARAGSRHCLAAPSKALRQAPGTYAIILILVALFAGNLWPEAKRYRRELLYDRGKINEVNFLAPYGPWGSGDICPLAMKQAAAYLKAHTRPSDPVLVFGHELALYVMADRFAPTRFAYDQPLVSAPRGIASLFYLKSLRDEFLKDIDKRPPVYIIAIQNDRTSIEPVDSYTQMRKFAELNKRIKRDYALETIIEDYRFYRRIAHLNGGKG